MPTSPPIARRNFLGATALAALTARAEPGAADERKFAPAEAKGYSLAEARKCRAAFDLKTCWNGGDVSRYVHLNMTEFFPHALIARNGPVKELKAGKELDAAKVSAAVGGKPRALADFVPKLDGFIVTHGGAIVFERYPQMRALDKHVIWSVSKVLPTAILAALEADKKVDLAQPVERYIPELAKTDWKGTPLRDISDMASGMTGLDGDPGAYENPDSTYGRYEVSLGTMPRTPQTPKTLTSTYDYVASMKRGRASGEAAEYGSMNTFVLSWVIESVTGCPYAGAVSERLWAKIGAESDAAILVSPAPVCAPGTHGYVSTTLRDLVRFGLLYTPSWNKVCTERPFPGAHVEQIQKGRKGGTGLFDKAGFSKDATERFGADRPTHNAAQWDYVWTDGDFFKQGYGGQGLYISPARDVVVAYFASGPDKAGELSSAVAFARAVAKSGQFGK